ncbi:MAG: ergothioneine biosynthesis protein EgtB [Actinomycetota bacterium]
MNAPTAQATAPARDCLAARYRDIRARTESLAAPLGEADLTVQSMDDASPGKWHLAHTTWFFEQFLLKPLVPDYRWFSEDYPYLFNSYYETVGARHPRPRRGLLTRPPLADILAYRRAVDEAMDGLLESGIAPATASLVELGLHHEQQHQELFLTDLLHLFAQNPLCPAYSSAGGKPSPAATEDGSPAWHGFDGGLVEIGHAGEGFAFDCEGPRHRVYLRPYALASRPVTNREWLEFMADGGYRTPAHWLSDGWARVQTEEWNSPLYWQEKDGGWWQMGLRGLEPLDLGAPVSQVSYFEADAFARWAGRRLPTEFEWEHAAAAMPVAGNFADSGHLRPIAAAGNGLRQLFGDVWEWTASAFLPYPGFRPALGAVGEYNGKFMCGQFVLRGGSCATPAGHLRPTYRNFFYPHQRWQFSGLRLADDP